MNSEERPHIRKAAIFENAFPHPLTSNEWKVKWPIEYRGAKTYNPDYWCEALSCFIELTTSAPNISEFGPKWQKAMQAGYPLRVFWWQGQEITEDIRQYGHWSVPKSQPITQ